MTKIYHSISSGCFLKVFSLFFLLSGNVSAIAAAAPEIEAQSFEIKENTTPGALIGTVQALNADSYQLSNGNEDGFFTLDEFSGELYLHEDALLDYGTQSTFDLTVQVWKGGEQAEALVSIYILEVPTPTAHTGTASGITEQAALLEGSFEDNGAESVGAIQYGTSVSLDDGFDPAGVEGMVEAAAGTGVTALQLELLGLEDATTYYYRSVAINKEDGSYISYGEIKSFTTLSIPWVESIEIRDQNPTNASSVSFLVTFTEDVSGVDAADFVLDIVNESGKSLTAEIGDVSIVNDYQYIVGIINIDGDGTLKLVFKDDGSVKGKVSQVQVGGAGAGNGDFEDGEIYTIDQTPPEFMTLIYTNEDVAVTYSISVDNAPDDPDDLIFSFSSSNTALVANDSYEVQGSGSIKKIRITPTAHAHGETTITLVVQDASGNQSEDEHIHVVVRAVADPPALVANDVSGDEDTDIPLDVSTSLVDLDGSEELESIEISGIPAGASLSAGTDLGEGVYSFSNKDDLNGIIFYPPTDASGLFTLTLSATAKETETNPDLLTKRRASASKTFDVLVNPVNDAPAFALSTDMVEREEDFDGTATITLTDESPENESDQTIVYSLSPASVDFANVSIDEATGTVTITAVADGFGNQLFTVTANDGQEQNPTFTQDFELIVNPVNDAPAFSLSTELVELDEDFTETITITLTDESPENESDQTILYSLSPASVDFANVSIDEATGTITITAVADGFGDQVFTVTANDGQDDNPTSTQDFQLLVNPVNDAPAFTLSTELVERDEDFEETVTITLTDESPENESDQTIVYSLSPASVDFANVSIDEATGTVTITAVADGFGDQVFTVTANDGQDENATSTQDFQLIVNPVNDAPAFTLSTELVERDEDFEETVTITLTDESPENESDQTIVYSLSPASVDFANVSIDPSTGTVTITAVADQFGDQVFTVTANDGQDLNPTYTQDFELIVNPVNDAPAFALSTELVEREEDFEGTVTVSLTNESPANESDQNIGYSLSPASVDFANISIDASTGDITITSVPDGFGNQVFRVIANDGQGENNLHEETFTLIVNPENDAPAFALSTELVEREEDFGGTVTITLTDESPENESAQNINYSLSPASVDFADINIDASTGNITITSVPDGFGNQVFRVIANDGQGENNLHEETFTLIVTPVNDAPAFALSTELVEREEDFEGTVIVTLTDESPENESAQTIVYSIEPESVDFANVSIDASTGNISITAKPDYFGSQVFTVTAYDGQALNHTYTQEFELIVNPVNDAPVFTLHPEEVIVEEDFTTEEKVVPELETPFAWGEEGESVSYSLRDADIDWAKVVVDPATGIVSITSVPDGNGEQIISLVATDNGSPAPAEYVQTFLLRVNPVNDAPMLVGGLEDQTTNEDALWEYNIPVGIFTDPDGDQTLTFSASLVEGESLPQWLNFDEVSKTFRGTPDGADVGEYQLLVLATDPEGESIQDSFTLTVIEVNDVPLISDIDDVSIDIGDPVPPITFTVSDEETPASELIVSVKTDNETLLPASAFSFSGEGEERVLEITLPFEEWGSALVTLTVSDGEAEAASAFTLTVNFKELAIDIPDLITPNGDNANDTWNIRFLGLYKNNEVKVFDRTGKMVFRARDYNEAREWDGTHQGKPVPEGLYYYDIKLDNGKINKRGTITIAR